MTSCHDRFTDTNVRIRTWLAKVLFCHSRARFVELGLRDAHALHHEERVLLALRLLQPHLQPDACAVASEPPSASRVRPGADVGRGEPSPGADVGRGEPSLGTDVAWGSPVPVPMWRGLRDTRRRRSMTASMRAGLGWSAV